MSNSATSDPQFRSGYVSLMGKPNVGKSTLVNRIVGQKVSIVSNKPQTTRRKVTGIANGSGYQIAFIDTPGIHEARNRLGRAMVEQARSSLADIDVILYVADSAHHPGEMDKQIADLIAAARKEVEMPVLLCLNKMDLLKAEDVERNVNAYTELLGTEEYMMTTATRGENIDRLVSLIVEKLPARAALYDEDEFTDQSTRFLAGELIREKVLEATRQEVPHSVAVMVDSWEEEPNLTRISASILVEKTSQRAILIGRQGQFIKTIGTKAREEIQHVVGKQVYLDLHVKVETGWRMNPRLLHELEYSD